jgi:hypothetical protein
LSSDAPDAVGIHRIPARVRDDRDPPLCGPERVLYTLDATRSPELYFLLQGWTFFDVHDSD